MLENVPVYLQSQAKYFYTVFEKLCGYKLKGTNKAPEERICPLCCEGIGDVCHYLTQGNNEEIKKVRHELMMPFYQNWKRIEKLSNEELCRAILSCQNEDLLVEIGVLCLKIQETFEAVAL